MACAEIGSGPRAVPARLSHLDRLESESIFIMHEAVAQSASPVMLYSIGKDSSVLLHLALKAFHPARLPFPLLHIEVRAAIRARAPLDPDRPGSTANTRSPDDAPICNLKGTPCITLLSPAE